MIIMLHGDNTSKSTSADQSQTQLINNSVVEAHFNAKHFSFAQNKERVRQMCR